jgi:glycosyltransferase involved in cell wall biosynthesis
MYLAPVNVVGKMAYRSGSGSEKCRILYIVGDLGRGGAERQLAYLLQAMNRQRYKPAVVVWNYSPDDVHAQEIEALGIPIYSFPTGVSRVTKLREVRRLARQLEPEVIHSYLFYTNFAAYWAALGTKAIAIGSLRGDFSHHKKDTGFWIGCLSARWPRDQIGNNFAAVKAARSWGTIFVPKSLSVVRNGIDLERFHTAPFPANGTVRVVGVGSLLSSKRWDRLMVAALELKSRGYDFKVQIIGDGPLCRSLQQLAHSLGIADRVEFTGCAEDVSALLGNAAFLAHTSDHEGCPNVIMEAMACGRAVVATDVGDVPYLVEDGKTGFVVRCGDHRTLVKRLMELITDRDLCHCMGEAGRAKAEQEFALHRLVAETLAAYRAVGWEG